MITAILLWLAGSVAIPRWLACLAALALFIYLIVVALGAWLYIEGKIFEGREDDR